MSKTILEVKNLSKDYDGIKALFDLSFSVNEGEIVGILGPNGAGKTTAINIILGMLKPTHGSVFIFGKNIDSHRQEAMEASNFSAVYSQLPGNLTVWQNLYFFGMLYGVKNLKERISFLLKDFKLEKFSKTKTGLLSSGEQSRANMAKAFINFPKLILFDEPTASLDPATSKVLRAKIKKYVSENKACILWASHNMQEIENVCDRIIFLSKGKIILEGDPKNLPFKNNEKSLEDLFISIAEKNDYKK